MRGPEFRQAVVTEALSWIDTKFAWGQSCKKTATGPGGCDCKGLIAGIARELGRPEGNSFEASMAGEYRRQVPTGALRRGLARLFDKTEQMQLGDILLLKFSRKAQHLAIYVGNGRMVHTYGAVGQVRSSPLGKGPHSWRGAIDSIWTWRD